MAQLEEADDARDSASETSKPKSRSSVRGLVTTKGTEPAVDEKNEEGEGNEEGGEEEEEKEYEIEAILDAKRGMFKKGEQAFLVKWKGYNEAHNSWVTETDAANAQDLINKFLKQRAKAKEQSSKPSARGRKPNSAKISKGTKAGSPDTESVSVSTTKRGRGKATPSESEDEEPQKAKKPRGPANGSTVTKRGRLASLDKTDDEDLAMVDVNEVEHDGRQYVTMKELKMHSLKSWEDVVKCITTIEQGKSDLHVFFELTDGRNVREPATICRKKFPQKLIDFYESHLKWRAAEDVDVVSD